MEVSIKGEALAIKRLSQAVRDNKPRIEKLFTELETVTNEHDAKAREYDRQLGEPAEIS
jgi:hypothetical protein